MEIRELESFLHIAKYGNFSKAAEKLGYTQSAVTVQIRNLEAELGVRLFDRIGKKTMLTHEGRVFYQRADDILRRLADAKTELSQNSVLRGRLSVGVVDSICTVLMPEILRRFHDAYPEVALSIVSGRPEMLLDQLFLNELDLVYLLDKRLFDTRLLKAMEEPEDILFVAAADSVYAKRERFTLPELAELPFILTESGASYRYLLDSYLASQELSLHPFLEASNTDLLLELLKSGYGISYLPAYTVKSALSEGKLCVLPVDMPHMRLWRQLVYHKDKWVNREMAAFFSVMASMEAERKKG